MLSHIMKSKSPYLPETEEAEDPSLTKDENGNPIMLNNSYRQLVMRMSSNEGNTNYDDELASG